jgi:hypothetical protein
MLQDAFHHLSSVNRCRIPNLNPAHRGRTIVRLSATPAEATAVEPPAEAACEATRVVREAAEVVRSGVAGTIRSAVMVAVALAFSMVIMLIADLDRPGEGFIKVRQDATIDLRRWLERQEK